MLRSEIIRPKSPFLMMGFGGGLIGAAIAMFVMRPRAQTIETVMVEAVRPTVGPSDVQLVFRAGDATYMKLGDAPVVRVRMTVRDHDASNDWQTTALGEIELATVPENQRHWLGKHVRVDGTCTAKVTGFAVVARVKGEASDAGAGAAWNADMIYEHGTPVLAARLDNCKDGTFARDAAAIPIVVPQIVDDPAIAKRAEEKLFASRPAQEVQHEWERYSDEEWTRSGTTSVDTVVMHHPITNVTWISVHAYREHGCGGLDVNVWGLYRVTGDELVAVQQRALGVIHHINRFLDLEGDGELEMIGTPWWGGDHIVERASGDEVTRLVLRFFGCPC